MTLDSFAVDYDVDLADATLPALSEADLLTYDALLEENDQDLMAWILGQSTAPAALVPLLARITARSAQARRSLPPNAEYVRNTNFGRIHFIQREVHRIFYPFLCTDGARNRRVVVLVISH